MSSDGDRRRGLPRGPHGLTKSYVERNQRERLIAAMTKAVEEQGYAPTSVTDVIERAGVSRKTFYAQFADRRDCLLAAYEEATVRLLDGAQPAVAAADGEQRLQALVDALCDLTAESPGTTRLLAVEIAAAGREGLAMRAETIGALGGIIGESLQSADGASPPPPELLHTLAGALVRVVDLRHRRRLKRADGAVLRAELTRWLRSYGPAPAGLGRIAEAADASQVVGLLGGRAPGTLSVAPHSLAAGTRSVSPSLTAHSQRERILDAIASLSMEKGYIALTVDEVCSVAGVSLNTFYEHFENKRDAFLVAHELGYIRGAAIVERALLQAPKWQAGVEVAIASLFGFLASEPAFAHLAAVEAPIAAPEAISRSARHLSAYAALLLAGAPKSRKPPGVISEATSASLHETVFAGAANGFSQPLTGECRRFAYVVLAPHLGPERAAEPATAKQR